ncbi:MAG: AMP-binding protein [Deltaproteobacteria bacterium]|nr:AMP-binding protein [Deltaproteobacteria bacterium]
MADKSEVFLNFSSLGEALRGACDRFAGRVALIEADREEERQRWTYRQAREEAERFAAALQAGKFAPEDRCAIVMSNQGKWLLSAMGVFWAGGVLVPLDFKLGPQEWLRLIRHSEPKILVVEWALWRQILEAGRLPQGFPKTFVTEAPAGAELGGASRWEEAFVRDFQYRERRPEDVAAIVYSSGTGGAMKGCMLTHANYLSQLEQFHLRTGLKSEDRYFSFLPTNHAIDFVFGFLYPLNVGAQVVHQRALRPQYLLPTFKKYRITATSMVPMLLAMLKSKLEEKLKALPGSKRLALRGLVAINRGLTQSPRHWISKRLLAKIHDEFGGCLRLIMTGGAFVEPGLARFFYDLGFFVGIGYGLTEAGTAVSAPTWGRYSYDNVGKVLHLTRVRIENPDERGVGEIWVKGPSVMKGYWKELGLTAETLVDGWLRTGDLGILEDGDTLKIVGRIKNMIVTEGGKNIYPEDVERYFAGLEECEEFCVFSKSYLWPDHPLERDQLLMVLRPKESVQNGRIPAALKTWNRGIPQYMRVSAFLLWKEEFPRTASLKLKRQNLADFIRHRCKVQDVKELRP